MQLADVLQEAKLPPLEGEVLLAAAMGESRTWVLAHGEEKIDKRRSSQFGSWVSRRRKHEPIAYILGEKEFYGRTFSVTQDVLIPRSETEEFVSVVLDHLSSGKEGMTEVDTDVVAFVHTFRKGNADTLIDIGTGSGCIAITLALETDKNIHASDICRKALSVAKKNAALHKVQNCIHFREGSILEPFHDLEAPFFLVSNAPYVPQEETPMIDVVGYEPHKAFYAGPRGMSVLRPLVEEAKQHPYCLGFALECRTFQAEKLSDVLQI